MGLPTSGPISMDDIRVELGVPSQSPFSLDTARAGGYVTLNTNSPTTPPSSGQVSLSSWYGYCQTCDTYNFTYSDTQAIACSNYDPITIISSTIPIGIGSILTNPDGSQAPPDYYYSDGTNWYYATGNLETTTVTSTGTCAAVNSVTIWFNNIQDGDPPYPYGYIDAGTACSSGGSSGQNQLVYYTGTLGDGTILYNDDTLTENFNYAGSFGWYWINFHKFTYDFGSIADYSVCD